MYGSRLESIDPILCPKDASGISARYSNLGDRGPCVHIGTNSAFRSHLVMSQTRQPMLQSLYRFCGRLDLSWGTFVKRYVNFGSHILRLSCLRSFRSCVITLTDGANIWRQTLDLFDRAAALLNTV